MSPSNIAALISIGCVFAALVLSDDIVTWLLLIAVMAMMTAIRMRD